MLSPDRPTQDAARSTDPTGTAGIRRAFRADLGRRWQQARRDVLRAVGEEDAFGLSLGGPTQISALAGGAGPVPAFQAWMEATLRRNLISPGLGPYVEAGYRRGAERAEGLTKFRSVSRSRHEAVEAAARADLDGIIQATVQQSVRRLHAGLAARERPQVVARAIANRIDKIGITRSRSLVDVAVVQAHAWATLDVMEEAGIRSVGIQPESHQHVRYEIGDAKKKPRKNKPKTRAKRNTRRSRGGKKIGQRELSRIFRAEGRIASLKRVNVLTAGDDEVCAICEDIAERGPYNIDRARSLIPAHPRCRCAFVPVEDRRFARDHTPGGKEHNQKSHGNWSRENLIAEGRQRLAKAERSGIPKNSDVIYTLASPLRQTEEAIDEIEYVANASSFDGAKRAIDSQTKWQGGWASAVDEWQAANDLGGNKLMSRSTKDEINYRKPPSITDDDMAAFGARRSWMQEQFKKEFGSDKVTVYRGVHGAYAQKNAGPSGEQFDLPTYALSSWTANRSQASIFAMRRGFVASTEITAEDVWLMPRRGVQAVQRIADAMDEIVILNKAPTRRVTRL